MTNGRSLKRNGGRFERKAEQGARANVHIGHASCMRRSRARCARGSSLTIGGNPCIARKGSGLTSHQRAYTPLDARTVPAANPPATPSCRLRLIGRNRPRRAGNYELLKPAVLIPDLTSSVRLVCNCAAPALQEPRQSREHAWIATADNVSLAMTGKISPRPEIPRRSLSGTTGPCTCA